MKSFISASLAVLIVLCALVATDRQAWGYMDPGSGLLTIQTIASTVAASAYFLRRRLHSLFSRNNEKVAVPPDSTDESPTTA
jgi:hypothetical protein